MDTDEFSRQWAVELEKYLMVDKTSINIRYYRNNLIYYLTEYCDTVLNNFTTTFDEPWYHKLNKFIHISHQYYINGDGLHFIITGLSSDDNREDIKEIQEKIWTIIFSIMYELFFLLYKKEQVHKI